VGVIERRRDADARWAIATRLTIGDKPADLRSKWKRGPSAIYPSINRSVREPDRPVNEI
jgi:hypothetical protein